MKVILQIISWVSLVLITAAPTLFFTEKIALELNKALMLSATISWFACAPGGILRRILRL